MTQTYKLYLVTHSLNPDRPMIVVGRDDKDVATDFGHASTIKLLETWDEATKAVMKMREEAPESVFLAI